MLEIRRALPNDKLNTRISIKSDKHALTRFVDLTAHVGPRKPGPLHLHAIATVSHVPPFMHCASIVHPASGAAVGPAVGAAVGGMVTGAAPPALAKLTWTYFPIPPCVVDAAKDLPGEPTAQPISTGAERNRAKDGVY